MDLEARAARVEPLQQRVADLEAALRRANSLTMTLQSELAVHQPGGTRRGLRARGRHAPKRFKYVATL